MNDEVIKALEVLQRVGSELSYDMICKASNEQKNEYHKKLETFLKYNSMKAKDVGAPKNLNSLKGKSLEELAAYLLKMSGDLFVVKQNIRTTTNEIDQIFIPTQRAKTLIANGIIDKHYELFLGECKNYNKSVDVTYVGKFCSLLLTNQIKFGLLFSYHGISGSRWSISLLGLTRRNLFFLPMPLSIRPCVRFEMMKQLQPEQTVRENYIAVVAV